MQAGPPKSFAPLEIRPVTDGGREPGRPPSTLGKASSPSPAIPICLQEIQDGLRHEVNPIPQKNGRGRKQPAAFDDFIEERKVRNGFRVSHVVDIPQGEADRLRRKSGDSFFQSLLDVFFEAEVQAPDLVAG
jgi:hypothetical protein